MSRANPGSDSGVWQAEIPAPQHLTGVLVLIADLGALCGELPQRCGPIAKIDSWSSLLFTLWCVAWIT